MSTSNLPNVPSLRRQQLLLDFASLKHAAPPGVYMTLSPGDPALWTGVIFVRSGPYASAILRLQIRFPPSYPDRPPLVTFSTDVFHPLIVPLTTYTFSTGSGVEDPVSAADEGRLPPGGFSLRHGFPHWFKHAKKDTPDATTVTGSMAEQTQAQEVQNIDDDNEKPPRAPTPAHNIPTIPVAELLDYIRSTFDTESILDSLPLEAAGNPGAWHAWRAHRDRRVGRVGFRSASSSAFSSTISTPVSTSKSRHAQSQSPQTRSPGDWHWDGIWANRALDEIKTSRSDVTLFGGMGRGGNGSGNGFSGDDMIRFSRLDDATLASIKEMMIPQIKEKGS